METAENSSNHSRRSPRRSSNSHISISDTDSTASQVDSWHSPLRSESPLRSDDPSFQPENEDSDGKNSKSLAVIDKYHSPVPSPRKSNGTAASPAAGGKLRRPWPPSEKPNSEKADLPVSSPPAGGKDGRRVHYFPEERTESVNLDAGEKRTPAVVMGMSKMVREEPPSPAVKKVKPGGGVDGGGLEAGYGGGGGGGGGQEEVGGERRSRAAVDSILKRSGRSMTVKRLALAFRVFEVIACLISFSVMAADKTQGWSGDSFDRYVEYRYCLAVNVIAFVYSGFQAFDLAYHLGTGKHVFAHPLRCHFDFAMDQILAYLLMSASSSAATRVDDWISNWGGDQFTLMASASISMSFLAFIAFAVSSLISGYILCNRESS